MAHDENDSMLRLLRQHWDAIWQASIWLGSVVLVAITVPPRYLGSDLPSNNIIKVTEVIIAVSVGFCFFLFRRTQKRLGAQRRYAFAGIALLIIGAFLFIIYQFEFDSWTCSYDGRGPVTIGTNLQVDAAKYVAAHPGADCEYLLQISAGKADKIWAQGDLVFHHLAMVATFLFSVLSFALAMLLTTMAVAGYVDNRAAR